MPYARVIGPEPPDEKILHHWESQGWAVVSIVGPCPVLDRKTGKPSGVCYCCYLHRSIVIGPTAQRPGWPVNLPPGRAGQGNGRD